MSHLVASKDFKLNNVASFLNTANTCRLSPEEAHLLVTLQLAGAALDIPAVDEANFTILMKDFSFNILMNRLPEDSRKQIALNLALFIVRISAGSPGVLVQWAWTVHSYIQCRKQNSPDKASNLVTLNDFTYDVFPNGLPSEEEASRIWIEQKCKGHPDNLLDLPNTWLN